MALSRDSICGQSVPGRGTASAAAPGQEREAMQVAKEGSTEGEEAGWTEHGGLRACAPRTDMGVPLGDVKQPCGFQLQGACSLL